MGDKISFNTWVWSGVALVIGFCLGWWLNGVFNPGAAQNGSFSTFTKDNGVSKITFTVPANDTAVVTSTMLGLNRKSVHVFSVSSNADVPITDARPSNPPVTGTMQTCQTGRESVGWKLPPGTYIINVGYDYLAPCDGILPTHTYALPPSITVATASASNGSTTRTFPVDSYLFDAHCYPNDDQTGITITMQQM